MALYQLIIAKHPQNPNLINTCSHLFTNKISSQIELKCKCNRKFPPLKIQIEGNRWCRCYNNLLITTSTNATSYKNQFDMRFELLIVSSETQSHLNRQLFFDLDLSILSYF